MRLPAVLLALVMVSALQAQRHSLTLINAESAEGKLLQLAATEADEVKKAALLEQYIARFPNHYGVPWAYSQLQTMHAKAGAHDKVVEYGVKLLAIEPGDSEAAYAALKAAEAKNDSAAVIHWSGVTADAAKKWLATPRPAEMEDDAWKHSQEFARQVGAYTEYSLYAAALRETSSDAIMRLAETLEQRNPKSEYLGRTMPKVAGAARDASARDRAIALGERGFANGVYNEDLLLAMADHYLTAKQNDKVIVYAGKVAEIAPGLTKPEGVPDLDWQKKKDNSLGLGFWMQGVAYSALNKFPEADKALRAALPMIQHNEPLKGMAAFHLGVANYRMGSPKKSKALLSDALKFSQEAAAGKNPYSAQALKNVTAIKSELATAK